MTVEKALLLAMMTAARDAREKAYVPYSGFKVGAAALGGSGKVFVGCNVENASYGLTICAERVAIQNAISEGEREIKAVVIVAGENEIARPCGACLQVIAEFAPKGKQVTIVTAAVDGTYDAHTLDEYLPIRFELEDGS